LLVDSVQHEEVLLDRLTLAVQGFCFVPCSQYAASCADIDATLSYGSKRLFCSDRNPPRLFLGNAACRCNMNRSFVG
jgi:hypothetical protein